MSEDRKKSYLTSDLYHPSSVFRCPRCGKGKLFKGALTIAERCNECGLSFDGPAQGDGAASLSILVVGAVVGIGSAVVEVKYEPPLWLHAAIWIPFIIIGSLLSLKLIKAALVTAQFKVRGGDFD